MNIDYLSIVCVHEEGGRCSLGSRESRFLIFALFTSNPRLKINFASDIIRFILNRSLKFRVGINLLREKITVFALIIWCYLTISIDLSGLGKISTCANWYLECNEERVLNNYFSVEKLKFSILYDTMKWKRAMSIQRDFSLLRRYLISILQKEKL